MPSAVIGSENSIENGSLPDEYERIFREDNPALLARALQCNESQPSNDVAARFGNHAGWSQLHVDWVSSQHEGPKGTQKTSVKDRTRFMTSLTAT